MLSLVLSMSIAVLVVDPPLNEASISLDDVTVNTLVKFVSPILTLPEFLEILSIKGPAVVSLPMLMVADSFTI